MDIFKGKGSYTQGSTEHINRREKESKNRLKDRDMKREERQIYYYTSRNTGERRKVYCTRLDYLFLKLYYDIDGLTPDEYEEYKAATR
mgnify:CR=1 FL=1